MQVFTATCIAYLKFMSSKLSVFVLKVSADQSCPASGKTVATSPPGDPRQTMGVPLIIKAEVRVAIKTDAVAQVGRFVQPDLSPLQARVTSTAACVLALLSECLSLSGWPVSKTHGSSMYTAAATPNLSELCAACRIDY